MERTVLQPYPGSPFSGSFCLAVSCRHDEPPGPPHFLFSAPLLSRVISVFTVPPAPIPFLGPLGVRRPVFTPSRPGSRGSAPTRRGQPAGPLPGRRLELGIGERRDDGDPVLFGLKLTCSPL